MSIKEIVLSVIFLVLLATVNYAIIKFVPVETVSALIIALITGTFFVLGKKNIL